MATTTHINTRPTIGSLCSGYGGLDLAVEGFFSARTAWFSEYDKAPSRILAHRWPEVPNHGDMTAIDWNAVDPVDIIVGGTPCQDLSAAGRRRGMTEGTRSNLWVQMREAVATIRPSLVIWENVRGAYTARAASEVESEPGLLGGAGDGRSPLRALGRVLGDFSELGYSAEWVGVRASDAGAPHPRYRVFVVAYADNLGGSRGWPAWARRAESAISDRAVADASSLRGGGDATAERRTEGADGSSLAVQRGADDHATNWAEFGPAIERWEAILGRPAPRPRVNDRLNAEFAEWMMGLPAGWVTDPAIGLSWNAQLKAIGNGVVPQQARLALSIAASRASEAVAA